MEQGVDWDWGPVKLDSDPTTLISNGILKKSPISGIQTAYPIFVPMKA